MRWDTVLYVGRVWSKSNKHRKREMEMRGSYWLALTLVFNCSCLLGVASAVKAAEREAQAAQQQRSGPPYACDTSFSNYRFCNTSISIRERAKDLVSRLTLDEKVSQLVNDAAAIPRLGIPAYEWWSEALHGVADAGPGVSFNGTIKAATSFPQIILTAATFDSHLWYRIAQAIGIEARAVYNEGQAKGMTFWAPNINIFRDPRWGRGQETPGEDPLVVGKYAVSYVRGVQGDSFDGRGLRDQPGGAHLQASACCKHFTAYDLDRWKNVTRYAFDAQVGAQDMADTYQPPFQSCIQEGRASGIMCAYNRVNGIPACADYNLLTETARGKWDFNGYITSDCDAVSIIHDVQGYAKTPEDAVSDVLKAGMDVNCGSYLKNHTKSAVLMNKVPEAAVDRALQNLFSMRIRLGLFDGNPKRLMFGDIGPNQVCTKEHQDLALEAAQNGIVLLKNNAKLLPLPSKGIQKTSNHNISTASSVLAVIGPNANSSQVLLGNYHGPPCVSVTPLQALQQRYVSNSNNNNVLIKYHPGCHDSVACSSASIQEAADIAKEADYVVLIMGLDQTQEREDYDRQNVVLPGKQQDLITQVARAAKNPVVLVVMCGGPVDISFAKGDNKVGGIIWAGYPGQAGGVALAQIIFGDHNPGGKLPMTWYPEDFVNSVAMTDMRMRADPASGYPGRTYRFYKGPTVFEFGHGLSYSTYSYEFLAAAAAPHNIHLKSIGAQVKVPREDGQYESSSYKRRFALVSEMMTIKGLCEKLKFSVRIKVRNHGDMDGKHLVLLYVRWHHSTAATDRPIKQLVGFQSASIKSRQEAHVEFTLSPCQHISRANHDGLMVMEEGTHHLIVGDQEFPITITVA